MVLAGIRRVNLAPKQVGSARRFIGAYSSGNRYKQAAMIFGTAFVAIGAKDILKQGVPFVQQAIKDRNDALQNNTYTPYSNWVGTKKGFPEAPMGATGDLPLALNKARNKSRF